MRTSLGCTRTSFALASPNKLQRKLSERVFLAHSGRHRTGQRPDITDCQESPNVLHDRLQGFNGDVQTKVARIGQFDASVTSANAVVKAQSNKLGLHAFDVVNDLGNLRSGHLNRLFHPRWLLVGGGQGIRDSTQVLVGLLILFAGKVGTGLHRSQHKSSDEDESVGKHRWARLFVVVCKLVL
jgi:hypothetical protein